MKVATWNVNSLKVRLGHVLDWLGANTPDVLALQETKLTDENFPLEAVEAAGYSAVYAGQKTYNGVAVLSKRPATDSVRDIPELDDPARRILAATIDGVRVVNLYVVNGQAVDSDKYAYKLEWLDKVTRYVAQELRAHERLIVLGDFNIAPEDRDVHDPGKWHEKILCSTRERDALRTLLDAGFVDAFRLFHEDAGHFSWWDYRSGAFRRNLGLRIDLILASRSLGEACTACTIDAGPRKLERPSDHAPVWAEFALHG